MLSSAVAIIATQSAGAQDTAAPASKAAINTASETALAANISQRERLGFSSPTQVGEKVERAGAALTPAEAKLFDQRFAEWPSITEKLTPTIEANSEGLTSIAWYGDVVKPTVVVRGLEAGRSAYDTLVKSLPVGWGSTYEIANTSRKQFLKTAASLRVEWRRAHPNQPDGEPYDKSLATETDAIGSLRRIGQGTNEIVLDAGKPEAVFYVDRAVSASERTDATAVLTKSLGVSPTFVRIEFGALRPASRDSSDFADMAGKTLHSSSGGCSSGPVMRLRDRPGVPPTNIAAGDYVAIAGHCGAGAQWSFADNHLLGFANPALNCNLCSDYGGVDIQLVGPISRPSPLVENGWITGCCTVNYGVAPLVGQNYQVQWPMMLCWEGASPLRNLGITDWMNQTARMNTSCGVFAGTAIGDQLQAILIYPGSTACSGDSGSIVRYPSGGGSVLVGTTSSVVANFVTYYQGVNYACAMYVISNGVVFYSNYGTWRHWLYWWRNIEVTQRMDWLP